ncbi:MAG: ABC transporter permease [Alphaproteobacteria bacterium]
MRRLLHRLVHSAGVLLVMSFVLYGLIGLMPGDPVELLVASNPHVTPEDVARLRHLHGLDQPLTTRYLSWLGRVLGGDFGTSRLSTGPVTGVLPTPLLNTLVLMGTSLVLTLLVALPMGVAAALKPHSMLDRAVGLLAFAGISVPVFWLGLMLIALFAVILGWLPAGGVATIGEGGIADRLRHLILPVATLTLAGIGQHSRYMRAAMIEALRQDHIRTARAKGASRSRIVLGHALRNAMIPVVTVLAHDFGTLFSGALITETVFAYPGMGRLIYDAIQGNDYDLALAALLLSTLMTLAGNALADAACLWLDPRIRLR